MSKGPKNRNTQGRQKENKLPTDRHDVTSAFKREFEGTVIISELYSRDVWRALNSTLPADATENQVLLKLFCF